MARHRKPQEHSRSRRPLMALASAGLLVAIGLPTMIAQATNTYTKPGNHTQGCAVSWEAVSDLSTSYTADDNGNGQLESDEMYSNKGYLFEVTSRPGDAYGPGDFLLHHWVNPGNTLGFRLPLATDHDMHNVVVVIEPTAGGQVYELADSIVAMGLGKYVAIDGNDKYTQEIPAPVDNVEGNQIILTWDTIPAGSANIFAFTGTTAVADAADPINHFFITAALSATYTEGQGCEGVEATPPVITETEPIDPTATETIDPDPTETVDATGTVDPTATETVVPTPTWTPTESGTVDPTPSETETLPVEPSPGETPDTPTWTPTETGGTDNTPTWTPTETGGTDGDDSDPAESVSTPAPSETGGTSLASTGSDTAPLLGAAGAAILGGAALMAMGRRMARRTEH